MRIISKKAFTLIEIMVAIAIIGIMVGVVLVSMREYAKRARSSKALAQLSSVIPAMYSCWGNGKEVKNPSSGGYICKEPGSGGANIAGYGNWPTAGTGTDLSSYSYSQSIDNTNKTFFVRLTSNDDDSRVCCNSAMKNCKLQYDSDNDNDFDEHENCTATTPSN